MRIVTVTQVTHHLQTYCWLVGRYITQSNDLKGGTPFDFPTTESMNQGFTLSNSSRIMGNMTINQRIWGTSGYITLYSNISIIWRWVKTCDGHILGINIHQPTMFNYPRCRPGYLVQCPSASQEISRSCEMYKKHEASGPVSMV